MDAMSPDNCSDHIVYKPEETPRAFVYLFLFSSSTISVLSRSGGLYSPPLGVVVAEVHLPLPRVFLPIFFSSHSLRTSSTLQRNHPQSFYFCFSLSFGVAVFCIDASLFSYSDLSRVYSRFSSSPFAPSAFPLCLQHFALFIYSLVTHPSEKVMLTFFK